MQTFDLVLVGFGNVGRRFVRLLEEKAGILHGRHGVAWRVVGIATGRHGAARNARGLDVGAALSLVEAGERLDVLDDSGSLPGRPAVPSGSTAFIGQMTQAVRQLDDARRVVVVETTVLDVRGGQPATDHVRAALHAGADVITANKGPVAFAYEELRALAEQAGRRFLFEGAVMDGIPIFNLAARTMPAVEVLGFRGVVNSTTNYIITAMENGREFDEALSEMQAAGIAEADASLDVDGWDAAAKGAAVANVLMGACVTPHGVERIGVGHLTGERVRAVAAAGRRVKLVARGSRENGTVRVAVAPEELPQDDLLAGLRDQQNALILETDLLGELAIVQLGGGLTQTAYALLSDLVALSEPA
jgi:homoserine dehydrogenase